MTARPKPLPPMPSAAWALFLDLDGTLLDIAQHPDLVQVPGGLVAVLQTIEEALDGAVAIVSGRPLQRLDELLKPWRPAAAGEHGAFCRLPSGDVVSPANLPAIPEEWRHRLTELLVEHKGVVIEKKQAAIAVHYRLAERAESTVQHAVRDLVVERADDFVVTPGHMVFEIRPRGADKGWAVGRLMRGAPFKGRVPVFIGDDVTDEDGIRTAESLGGQGLNVDRYFKGDAGTVRDWLSGLPGRVQAQSAASWRKKFLEELAGAGAHGSV